MEIPEKNWSSQLLYRTAERMPMGIPTRDDQNHGDDGDEDAHLRPVGDDREDGLVKKDGGAEISPDHP
ncbi:hypothetical protein MASR2M79_13600 [Aminivibrio sp.]